MYQAIEEFIQAQSNPTPISNTDSKQQQNCSIASSFLTFRFLFPERGPFANWAKEAIVGINTYLYGLAIN